MEGKLYQLLGWSSAMIVVLVSGFALFEPKPSAERKARTPAAIATPDSFNYESLLKLVSDHQVKSIDELLPLLPQDFRENYVTIYRTRSNLQEASEADPRMILYNGSDAKLMMTFNGNPAQKGYDSLEVMQYRDSSKTFELHEVKFPYDSAHPPKTNPAICLQCHGAENPRPNWDSYFLWPGIIGAHDGDIFARDQERQKAIDWSHGRYQFLKPNLPVMEPNSKISGLLGLLNGQRIAKIIHDTPKLKNLRYAILGAVSCSDGRYDLSRFLPDSAAKQMLTPYENVLADTISKNHRYFSQKLSLVDRDLSPVAPNSASALTGKRALLPEYQNTGPEFPEQIARFRYLVEGLGVSTERWNLPFDLNTASFNDGVLGLLNPYWWSPIFDPSEDSETLNLLSTHSEIIQDYFEELDTNHPKPNPPAEYTELCDLLAKKSLAALKGNGDSPPSRPTVPDPPSSMPPPGGPVNSNAAPPVVKLCMSCHVGSERFAPAIPFDQPGSLSAWLKSGTPDGKTKLDLLKGKISNTPVSGSRMPPFRVLAPDEQTDLLNYLQSLN